MSDVSDDFGDLPVVGEAKVPGGGPEAKVPAVPVEEKPMWPEQEFFLPDRKQTRLLLTAAVSAVLHDLFRQPDRPFFWPDTTQEAVTLLWFCAHGREQWGKPGRSEDGTRIVPLYLRPFDLMDVVQEWLAEEFESRDLADLHGVAIELWLYHHEAKVHADDAGVPEAQKKRAAECRRR